MIDGRRWCGVRRTGAGGLFRLAQRIPLLSKPHNLGTRPPWPSWLTGRILTGPRAHSQGDVERGVSRPRSVGAHEAGARNPGGSRPQLVGLSTQDAVSQSEKHDRIFPLATLTLVQSDSVG